MRRCRGKHWNRTYTDEQRAAVAALPGAAATRESMIAFGLGAAELLVTRARPLFVERGSDLAGTARRGGGAAGPGLPRHRPRGLAALILGRGVGTADVALPARLGPRTSTGSGVAVR